MLLPPLDLGEGRKWRYEFLTRGSTVSDSMPLAGS